MSYVRFGEDSSDVYVFMSSRGLECCGCSLQEHSFVAQATDEMIHHLAAHRDAGHYVPAYVDGDVLGDDDVNFEVPPRPTTDAEFAALPVLNLNDFHQEQP